MFEQLIQFSLLDWFFAFFNPQKRIFWGYLCSAFIISLFWFIAYKKKPLKIAFHEIFSAESWLSKSAIADYLLMVGNSPFIALFSLQLQRLSILFIALSLSWLHNSFNGDFSSVKDIPASAVAIYYTLSLFIFDDFVRYWLHRWLHTVPLLWSFHKVHHSATSLNPLTVFRVHPVEALLMQLGRAFAAVVCVIVFVFFFSDKVTVLTVLGASIFTFLFNVIGSNLRHSHIPISYYRPLERIFISPAQHQIHHSSAAEHLNKNYGIVFSLWDLWFGSHCYSLKNQALSYGLQHAESNPHSFSSLYWRPFQEAKKIITDLFITQNKYNNRS